MAARIAVGGSLFAVGLALLAVLLPARVMAQTPAVIDTQMDQSNFPVSIGFSALVDEGDALESAVLFYQVPPEGAITRENAEITSGDVTRLEADVPTNRGLTYIPPGADIEWWWALTSTDGETIETERSLFRYADPRYDWQVISGSNIELYYYENETVAEALHVVGREAVARMGELLGVTLDFPAKIYLWSNPQDAVGVERTESDTFEQLIFTGGTRVLADLVHVFAPQPWIVSHELTHVLTKIAGESIAGLPAWLDEGTATYAETDWRSRRGGSLQSALNNDAVLSVRSIGSATNTPSDVDLFYGESADIVTALIDEFGEDTFARLFAVFKEGTTVDDALMQVYGFDRDGLDTFYRENRGLEARGETEDRSTQIEDEPVGAAGAEPSDAEQSESGAGQAQASPEQPEAQADAVPDSQAESDAAEGEARDASQVAARQEAVEVWNSRIRLGPAFGPGDGFAWEIVVTAVGGVALALSLVLLFVALGRPAAPAAVAADAGGTHWQGPTPPMPPPPTMPGPGGHRATSAASPWGGWQDRSGAEASGDGLDGDDADGGGADAEADSERS
jgi:hypothetical protein